MQNIFQKKFCKKGLIFLEMFVVLGSFLPPEKKKKKEGPTDQPYWEVHPPVK